MRMEGVQCAVADMCMYGMQTKGRDRREVRPARKRTKFMTNCDRMAEHLSAKCKGLHEHQHLVDGRARAAAQYPQ
eukprot:6418966-Lingulodinium_polyedra.AAC.1